MENKVELLGYYGSDKVIACSAWSSTQREITPDKESRIPSFVRSLWMDGHETPYEKATVHFLVDTDIASHIHLLKHRISSANAESARYKELKEDKYFIPMDWKNNCNSSGDHPFLIEDGVNISWLQALEKYTKLGNELYHLSLKQLTPVLGRKRAKESCRYFKTYNSQIQCDIMFNLRSFANLMQLRISDSAQLEIKEIVSTMARLVESIDGNPFKHSMQAIRDRIEFRKKAAELIKADKQ